MTKRLLESLTGICVIHAGDVQLRRTSYTLSLYADGQPGSVGEEPAAVSIDGHIDITGFGEALVLAGPGTLTMTLEDGRRMAFQLTGTGGAIVGRGWLPRA